MRTVHRVSRVLFGVPRSRISSHRSILTFGTRFNSSRAGEQTEERSNPSSDQYNGSPSRLWTPVTTLLVSAFAAGLGYGYASYNTTPTEPSTPQYGSTKEFSRVSLSLASFGYFHSSKLQSTFK